MIAAPLIDLLIKDSFKWSKTAKEAFSRLHKVLTQAPILALLHFSKPFVLETDASGIGIGAVLSQDNHLITFFSKKMSPMMQKKSGYVRQMHAIIVAVPKFRHYLLGHCFVIQADHKVLRECNLKSYRHRKRRNGYQNYWVLISPLNIRRAMGIKLRISSQDHSWPYPNLSMISFPNYKKS